MNGYGYHLITGRERGYSCIIRSDLVYNTSKFSMYDDVTTTIKINVVKLIDFAIRQLNIPSSL